MKITFENVNTNTPVNTKASFSANASGSVKGTDPGVEILKSLDDNKSYDGKKKSVNEFKDSIKDIDVKTNQDYMAVMSGCMSDEDFKSLVENGGNPGSMEVKDAVTIVDKIKLTLAQSGTEVKGYTDTLDEETIKEITGLSSISSEAKELDITLTESTCAEIKDAVSVLSDVTEMTEGIKKYLVSEGKDLTIDNLYLAKHSACAITKSQGSQYFSMEAPGYYAKAGDETDINELETEVRELLGKIGVNETKENVNAALWLVNEKIEVSKENIEKVNLVDSVNLPITDEKASKAIAIAISEGKEPKNADITKEENIYALANRLAKEIDKVLDTPFIKETRVLEETRLKMTAEANLLLLKSDYQIDIKDLEKYVDKLKEIENEKTFKEVKEVIRVEEKVEAVKALPAAVLAPISKKIDVVTLDEIVLEGNALKEKYEAVTLAYEQVGTEVRKDLGDSIKKAFRNVPQILESLGMENSKENARAVRILGYNSIPITKESIDEIKEADKKLLDVINRITPKDTLSLIREGKSPIEMSIKELNEYLDSKVDTQKEEIEKYSKFLYKLERDGDISKEERKDYIEVYRFFHQIEKTEAAAVGMVMNAGQEMTLRNLSTAMKTVKHKGMDVTVGEVYDTLVSEDNSALESEWISHKYLEMKAILEAPEETVTELVMNQIPVTAENLEAALNLRKNRGDAFRKASEARNGRSKEKLLSIAGSFENDNSTKEAYADMVSESKSSVYEECLEKESFVDVRALQLAHLQLSLASSYASTENYEVPMEIGGQVTSVNVKLVHNTREEANVVISLETEDLGRISARLYSEKEEITGYISCNLKETVTKMEKVADTLGTKVSVVWSKNSDTDLTLARIPMKDNDTSDTRNLYEVAKRFLGSMKGIMNEN